MKYLTCLILLLALVIGLSALTVTKEHYGYNHNALRDYKQGVWNQSATDLSEGSGKTWSFALPVTGFVHNHYSHVNGSPNFPDADITCVYTQYVNGIDDSGTMYYQQTDNDILNLGYATNPITVWTPPIPTGLPHYLGKTWQGNHAWTYGSYNISGKVISEGTVSTHLGSFEALCVRYHYSGTNFSYYYYQWETAEYGIIAYTTTLIDGMLYVLESASPNEVATQDEYQEASPGLSAYPNPARDVILIKAPADDASAWRISLYDLRGRRLLDLKGQSPAELSAGQSLDLKGLKLASGIYLLRAENGSRKLHTRLMISR